MVSGTTVSHLLRTALPSSLQSRCLERLSRDYLLNIKLTSTENRQFVVYTHSVLSAKRCHQGFVVEIPRDQLTVYQLLQLHSAAGVRSKTSVAQFWIDSVSAVSDARFSFSTSPFAAVS